MTSEPPEFHTKIRTPVSPLPVRPPNPLDIPVLRNQIDPTFNMTTTHEETKKPDDSPLSDTRFSDAYDEKDEEITGDKIEDEEAEASDDYAMTFESDGEENTDSHDQSQAVDQEPKNSSNIVPPSDLPTSIPNERPPISYSQSGPEIQPAPAIPSPTLPTNSESAAAQSSDDPSHTSTIATNPIAPEDPTGGIDIQQLLDNITANAEINAAAARPSSSSSSNAPPLKSGSSLPTHASLPPRPQVTQQPLPKRSNYPSYDDAYKYNAGAQGYSHAPTSYRPSGVTPSLIASGAPGTATDSRYGLPPPPSVSFSQSNQDPNSPKPYRQSQRMTSVASSEGHDDERPWGPAVQKIYDEFLDRERKYVTEGLWERFPKGSRLFIGKHTSRRKYQIYIH
jgi:nuclear polyadenylated RNA-binding protein 3